MGISHELDMVQQLHPRHHDRGAALFAACGAQIFPCDALAFAILERSLNLLKSFHMLLSNGGYVAGAALLRMQLDSVLRFNGVAISGDPHGTASAMYGGTPLRKIKDRHGERMTDRYLVELFKKRNP